MTYKLKASAIAATIAMAGFFAQPANAAIICDGDFQLVKGIGYVASSYCEDRQLARLARKRGMKTSARAIRNSPSTKEEACATVGFDPRIYDACFLVGGRDS